MNKKTIKIIKIFVGGGMVEDVTGMPKGWDFEIVDRDCDNYTTCLECLREFNCETDIQLCSECMKLFNVDKLWKLHDKNKIDALDFNESKKVRERFRKKKVTTSRGYVIVYRSTGKRVRLDDGSLTPYFKYPSEVVAYVTKRLSNSPAIRIKTIKK